MATWSSACSCLRCNLSRDGLLDRNLRIVGVDHNPATAEEFAARLHAFMAERDKGGEGAASAWTKNSGRGWPSAWTTRRAISSTRHQALGKRIDKTSHGNAIFYLATSPRFFPEVAQRLGEAGLLDESAGGFRRVVVEKPFGTDLASAEALNACLLKVMGERQIYV